MRQNLLQINVFYNSLNKRSVGETVKYDLITTIYAIGGAISLYLGVSLAMIFEVIEFVFDTMINLAGFCFGRKPTSHKEA